MLSSQISGDRNAAERYPSRDVVKAKFPSSLVMLTIEGIEIVLWSGFEAQLQGWLLLFSRVAAELFVDVLRQHLKFFGDVPFLRWW